MKATSAIGALIATAILCISLGVYLVQGPTPASGAEVCTTKASQLELIKEHGLSSVEYSGERWTKLFAVIQKHLGPPPPQLVGTTSILVALMEDEFTFSVGWFEGDCLVGAGMMPRSRLNEFLTEAFGQGV